MLVDELVQAFPPLSSRTLWLHKRMIDKGRDDPLPRFELVFGRVLARCDSLTFALSSGAARCYAFDPARPLSLAFDDQAAEAGFDVYSSPTTLRLTIAPGSLWTSCKATFHFIGINGTATPPDFDPLIRNGGGPRG